MTIKIGLKRLPELKAERTTGNFIIEKTFSGSKTCYNEDSFHVLIYIRVCRSGF